MGFKFNKGACEFKRRDGDLFDIYRCSVSQKAGWISVWSMAFVASPDVNKIYASVLSCDVSPSDPTFGFAITNLYSNRGSYAVERLDDLEGVIASLELDFEEVAVPFFNRHRTVDDIERSLNRRDAGGKWRSPTAGWALYGLIAAKICNNHRYEEIFADYYEWLKEFNAFVRDLELIYNYFRTDVARD